MTRDKNIQLDFLAKLLGLIGASISLIGTLIGFGRVWQGDLSWLTGILLAAGFSSSIVSCAYIAFKRTRPLVEGGKGTWQYQHARPFALAGLILISLVLTGMVGYFFGSNVSTPAPKSIPPVSLISLRYSINNYDPRIVDLRTASISGIPSTAGEALRLFDLYVSSPANAQGCVVQAEIYVNNKIIGVTPSTPLRAGITKLGDVKVESYNDGTVPKAWKIQPDWENLFVFVITYRSGEVIDRNLTIIHLSADGTAWLLDPPSINFASIVYGMNNGPDLVLDLRDASKLGLSARPSDKLTLREIWYNSNATSNSGTVHVEAFLTSDGYNPSTLQITPSIAIRKGIHKIEFAPMTWVIPEGKQTLDLTIYRDDGAVMDMLLLPLKPEGSPGLIRVKDK